MLTLGVLVWMGSCWASWSDDLLSWVLGSLHPHFDLGVGQVGNLQWIDIAILCRKAVLGFESGGCRAGLGETSSTTDGLYD